MVCRLFRSTARYLTGRMSCIRVVKTPGSSHTSPCTARYSKQPAQSGVPVVEGYTAIDAYSASASAPASACHAGHITLSWLHTCTKHSSMCVGLHRCPRCSVGSEELATWPSCYYWVAVLSCISHSAACPITTSSTTTRIRCGRHCPPRHLLMGVTGAHTISCPTRQSTAAAYAHRHRCANSESVAFLFEKP